MKIRILFLLFLALVFSSPAHAQVTDSTLIQIETNDGNEFVGKIVAEDSIKIVLKTDNLGEITIKQSDVKSRTIVEVQQIKDGKLWFANPQSTRYFWAPNAYGLKKGEGYYQNIYVFWNQFSFGISDNFSIGGGIIPLFLFGEATPVFITPKISIPIQKNKFSIGAGALLGTIIGDDSGVYGLLYGITTFGSPDNNVSLGLAYGFTGQDWANSPLINISGLFRISKRGYLITENYYVNSEDGSVGVIGLGGRWIIKKASLDFMLLMPYGTEGNFIAFPAIGFTIPFAKK